MSQAAIVALTSEIARAQEIFGSLTEADWQVASACDGWRVQDVACHMASVFHSIADPSTIAGGDSSDVEANAEVPVQARREWTVAQVRAEYDQWSTAGLAALAGFQEPPMHDMVIPLANLGSHPMHLLANAIVFDHYCHLRHDIGAAIPAAAALPHDDLALTATLEWMLAGVPQMCGDALSGCDAGVNLVVDGPAAGSWILRPGSPWTVTSGNDDALATATTSAHSFVSWATKRADWRASGVILSGPSSGGAEVTLDALNVI